MIRFLLLTLTISCCFAESLLVYSERNQQLIGPVLKKFTEQSGIPVKLFTGSGHALLQRIKGEGKSTAASIYLSTDVGTLFLAEKEKLLRAIDPQLLADVPAELRSSQSFWSGVSLRARAIFYHPELVKKQELSSYTQLAQEQWKNRLCLRTSSKVYNQSLVAMLLAQFGRAQTNATLKGWVQNLQHPVFSDDSSLLKAIAKKSCAIGIANTYYWARMLAKKQASEIQIFFPAETHINISGVAILKHAPQPELAKKLVQWLLSAEGQKEFSQINYEYPVMKEIPLHPLLSKWPKLTPSQISLERIGQEQRQAMMLIEKAGYQ